jgi:hypothetical protein
VKYILLPCKLPYNVEGELKNTFEKEHFEIVQLFDGRIEYTEESLVKLNDILESAIEKVVGLVKDDDEIYVLSSGSVIHNTLTTRCFMKMIPYVPVKYLIYNKELGKHVEYEMC